MTKKDEIAEHIERSLKEVELMRAGKLPKRSAREMLKRVRRRIDDEEK